MDPTARGIARSRCERAGLLVAEANGGASPYESKLLQGVFEVMLSSTTSGRFVGRKACNSGSLDDQIACMGSVEIIPRRESRKLENATLDGGVNNLEVPELSPPVHSL